MTLPFARLLLCLLIPWGVIRGERPDGQSTNATSAPSPSSSLLRVNVSNQGYDFRLPWQRSKPAGKRGLGALLEENRVLVTAELVADATYIDLELPASGRKLTAEV